MNRREKTAAIMVGFGLLALGTGFAFFNKKKADDLPDVDDDDTDDCPPNYVRDPVTGECVPGRDPFCPPDPQGRPQIWSKDEKKCVLVNPPHGPDAPDIDDIIKPYPEGGNFYQVKKGDWPGSSVHGSHIKNYTSGLPVAGWLIRREMFQSAREFGGLSNEAAIVWVDKWLKGSKLVNPSSRTLDVILCSAFNDATTATWGYCGDKAINAGRCKASMRNHPGPNGRAIRFLTDHPDNITRVRQGLVVARYVGLGSPGNAGDGMSKNESGKSGKYPALWMPTLDRKALWESANASGGFPTKIVIEPTSETWEDGSPLSSPPPWVMKDGQILDYSGSLSLPGAYGCAGGEVQFSPGG